MNMHIQPTSSKNPHPVDVAVGANVRRLRTAKGMSQEKLGENLGITFQQVQKYENGVNRISASKLAMLATAFGVTFNDLFKGVELSDGKVSAPKPLDPRVHKASLIFRKIDPDKMDHAIRVLKTFTEA
ncbi:helix-turn-helix domain-containing protein [Hoeflea sp.]|uniref:helix-turn-helix domain-containing protein n=1 Tax=Hoeflea sp. TaxID=1940281 RepID=UPI003B516F31